MGSSEYHAIKKYEMNHHRLAKRSRKAYDSFTIFFDKNAYDSMDLISSLIKELLFHHCNRVQIR